MKPNILIHTLTFSPDQVSTAYLYGDIALKLYSQGWNVEVFTTFPHYNYTKNFRMESKGNRFLRRTDFNGIKVTHFTQRKNVNLVIRFIYLFSFHFAFLIRALFGSKYDVVLTPSPPITSGFLSAFAAKLRGAKAIYNVQEIYPDILLKSTDRFPKVVYKCLSVIERKTYQWSHRVTVIDKLFEQTIMNRMSSEKLVCIPNFVDTDLYKPEGEFPTDLNFDNKYVVCYFGNLGKVMDWETLTKTVESLSSEERIMFLLVGGGSEYERLRNFSLGRNNCLVLPYQSREKIQSFMARGDLHIICMTASSDYDGLPSKTLTILSAGKPILAATSEDSPIATLLKNSGNAVVVKRGDYSALAEAILALKNERILLNPIKGRSLIIENYSKEVVLNKYISLISNLLDSDD